MDFKALQDSVLGHRFNDTKYRPFIKTVLNEAQNRVARQASLRSQYEVAAMAVTAGDDDVAVPADFAALREVADASDLNAWRVLEPMSLRDFDEAASAAGSPTNYILIGSAIYLYPTPAADMTLTISYQRLPATMVADSDTPEIPADYHYILEYWALYRCFNRENDIEQAQIWRAEFENELNHLRGEVNNDNSNPSSPNQVTGMWGGSASPAFRVP